LSGAERERRRLGRELHDGLCQSLAGIAALSSTLSRSLAADGRAAPAAAASEIVRLLNEAIGEARGLAHDLNDVGVNSLGLVDGLEALARRTRDVHSVACAFDWDRRWPRLCAKTETHLLRIAQEAVHNAIAHGRADRIEVSLDCVGGFGVLAIRDDGVGLPDDERGRDGIGLQTMCYRAREIGGAFSIARLAERGTMVRCSFALPRPCDLAEGRFDVRGHA